MISLCKLGRFDEGGENAFKAVFVGVLKMAHKRALCYTTPILRGKIMKDNERALIWRRRPSQ